MGRILSLILAAAAATAGFYLGDMLHNECGSVGALFEGEFPAGISEGSLEGPCIAYIATGNRHLPDIEWRQLYAVISGVIVWIVSLNYLWPRR